MIHFNPSEKTILVEVYLPKRSYLQGQLYSLLTNGFKPRVVSSFLIDNEDQVRKSLEHSSYFLDGFRDAAIGLRPVFSGYSLYEVDGVFRGKSESDVVEERTQVIRIIFRPEVVTADWSIDDLSRRSLIKRYLKKNREDNLLQEFPENSAQWRLLMDLRLWEQEVALFVFGYLVVGIRMELERCGKSEDEIWITSIWGESLNRVTNTHE